MRCLSDWETCRRIAEAKSGATYDGTILKPLHEPFELVSIWDKSLDNTSSLWNLKTKIHVSIKKSPNKSTKKSKSTAPVGIQMALEFFSIVSTKSRLLELTCLILKQNFKENVYVAKYFVFVSSRSVKLRELSFAQFVDFLRKVCLFFNF